MSIVSLISSLEQHAQDFPLEKSHTNQSIAWILEHREFAFVRNNTAGHITASLLITNPEKTKVLLMFHKKLQMWLQFGGHCDGEMNTLGVAIREFHEESGIEIEPDIVGDIYNVDIHRYPEMNNTPAHNHYDIMYLGILKEDVGFDPQKSEVDDIRWIDINEIGKYVGEKLILDMIEKIQLLGK